MTPSATPEGIRRPGSKDGLGWSDCDQPFRFGHRPRALAPFPFTPWQFARLLALRGRVKDALRTADPPDPLDAARLPLARRAPSLDPHPAARAILDAAGVLAAD